MDILDEVKYTDQPVDLELSQSYRAIFNGSPESRRVLEDMMNQCLWGKYSNDPELQREITISQKIMWRIKAMLNGKPTKQEIDEYE